MCGAGRAICVRARAAWLGSAHAHTRAHPHTSSADTHPKRALHAGARARAPPQEEREDEERITTFKVARARRRWRFVAYLARETRGTMARAATDSEQIKVYWYACTSWRDGTYYFTIATPHPSFRPRHFATATPLGLSFDERRALTG
eukprot:5410756-Prymnesium_polylepis.1